MLSREIGGEMESRETVPRAARAPGEAEHRANEFETQALRHVRAGLPGQRRLFGAPPSTGGVVALLCCVASVTAWLLASGHELPGVATGLVVLGLGLVFAPELREALLRGRITRLVRGGARRLGARVGVAQAVLSAWSRGAVELLALRAARRRLERRLTQLIHTLGEAVYQGDSALAAIADAEAHATAARLAESERARAIVIGRARRRVAGMRRRPPARRRSRASN